MSIQVRCYYIFVYERVSVNCSFESSPGPSPVCSVIACRRVNVPGQDIQRIRSLASLCLTCRPMIRVTQSVSGRPNMQWNLFCTIIIITLEIIRE